MQFSFNIFLGWMRFFFGGAHGLKFQFKPFFWGIDEMIFGICFKAAFCGGFPTKPFAAWMTFPWISISAFRSVFRADPLRRQSLECGGDLAPRAEDGGELSTDTWPDRQGSRWLVAMAMFFWWELKAEIKWFVSLAWDSKVGSNWVGFAYGLFYKEFLEEIPQNQKPF